MKNKGLSAVVIAILASVVIIAAVVKPNVNRQSVQNEKPATTESGEIVGKPTFMYFVTNDDLNDKTTKAVIAKLECEFGQKVIFGIRNVDADKSILDNFPLVKDNTPALIMLKSNNDISAFLFKTNDYEKLKEAIEAEME